MYVEKVHPTVTTARSDVAVSPNDPVVEDDNVQGKGKGDEEEERKGKREGHHHWDRASLLFLPSFRHIHVVRIHLLDVPHDAHLLLLFDHVVVSSSLQSYVPLKLHVPIVQTDSIVYVGKVDDVPDVASRSNSNSKKKKYDEQSVEVHRSNERGDAPHRHS